MLEPSLDAVKSRFGSQRRVQRRRRYLWPDSEDGTRATIGAVLRARADAPPTGQRGVVLLAHGQFFARLCRPVFPVRER